jgi:hypothetical protein
LFDRHFIITIRVGETRQNFGRLEHTVQTLSELLLESTFMKKCGS